MNELAEKLREEFLKDKEYAHAYMEEFENSYIATQIKVLREQNGLTQNELAERAEMKQERISVLENVNYSSWSIKTLRKLARAFDLVLHVSFKNFGDEIKNITSLDRGNLSRISREMDLGSAPAHGTSWIEKPTYIQNEGSIHTAISPSPVGTSAYFMPSKYATPIQQSYIRV